MKQLLVIVLIVAMLFVIPASVEAGHGKGLGLRKAVGGVLARKHARTQARRSRRQAGGVFRGGLLRGACGAFGCH